MKEITSIIYYLEEKEDINEEIMNTIVTSNMYELFNYYTKNYESIVITPLSEEEVILGREHNNSKIMILNSNLLSEKEITKFHEIFSNTNFSNEQRHIERIKQMRNLWK